MTSIKEALERLIADIEDYERVNNLSPSPGKDVCWQSVADAKAALATLSPPAGERREAIARPLERIITRRVLQDRIDGYTLETSVEMSDALLASGLVQDEAGWCDISTAPKDMTEIIVLCGRKDIRLGWYFAPSSTSFGWRDQHNAPIKPTKWMPLPAIRSARDGGAES